MNPEKDLKSHSLVKSSKKKKKKDLEPVASTFSTDMFQSSETFAKKKKKKDTELVPRISSASTLPSSVKSDKKKKELEPVSSISSADTLPIPVKSDKKKKELEPVPSTSSSGIVVSPVKSGKKKKELEPVPSTSSAGIILSPVKSGKKKKELEPVPSTSSAGIIPSPVKSGKKKKELEPVLSTPSAGIVPSPVKSSKTKKELEPIPSTSSADTFLSYTESSSKESILDSNRPSTSTDVSSASEFKITARRRTFSDTLSETKEDVKLASRRRTFSDNTHVEDNISIETKTAFEQIKKVLPINLTRLSLGETFKVKDSSEIITAESSSADDSSSLHDVPNCQNCSPKTGRRCWELLRDWCRFPRMKCACMDTNSYERLPSMGGFMALNTLRAGANTEDKDSSTEKQELLFYNDDGSFQSVVVERNLCATDLCQLLALKNRVAKDVNWTIIEHWVELGLERLLEDHEDVLSAHRDMENYSRHAETRFIFRKDFRKYEFFHHPEQFFPADMIDLALENCEMIFHGGVYSAAATLRNMILIEGRCPSVFSHVWVLDPEKQMWSKGFLLLRDKKVYLSYKLAVVAKFLRSGKVRDSTYFPVSEADADQLTVLARLSDFHVYAALNAKNQFRAPTEWGVCLRPSGIDSDPTADLEDDVDTAGPGVSNVGLCCLACESERARTCWLTAMRLAKYGKQLRENYRAFKNKQVESINPKEYNSYTVPNESVRSRVAMDFTGSVGRIVEDPKEAKAIAAAEGYSWRRRWRPSTRTAASAQSPIPQGIESGVHITQPWFHSGMSRDQAATLVTRYGTVDGVFLVRDSRSNPGAFVLTYKCGGKVLHTQITPILDPVREAHVFSLDNGFTKFYDLLQLVEFYQLNAGVLPTRLTHYVVQSPTGINVPAPTMAPSVAGSF